MKLFEAFKAVGALKLLGDALALAFLIGAFAVGLALATAFERTSGGHHVEVME